MNAANLLAKFFREASELLRNSLDKILNSLYVDWSLKFIRDSYNPIKLVFLLSQQQKIKMVGKKKQQVQIDKIVQYLKDIMAPEAMNKSSFRLLS